MFGPSWFADLICLKGQFLTYRGHVLCVTLEYCTVCLLQQTELLQGLSSLQHRTTTVDAAVDILNTNQTSDRRAEGGRHFNFA